MAKTVSLVKTFISSNRVAVFSKSYCPFCELAKQVLKDSGVKKLAIIELDETKDGNLIQDELFKMTNVATVPQIFINNKFIGGGTILQKLQQSGELNKILKTEES